MAKYSFGGELIFYTIKLQDTATILPVSDAFFIYIFTKLHSQRFVNQFSKIINKHLHQDVKIDPIFKSFKINSYFQLKSCTPLALCSNVVYKFTCSCDTNLTYIGMSSRHLSTRVREHLNLNSKQKSSIKDHIAACNFCSKTKIGIDSFKIIRKCRSDYDTKIHEALLIKKHSPGLNRQLYASGASFLLQVF